MRTRQLPDPSPLTEGGRIELRLIEPAFGPGPTSSERDSTEPSTATPDPELPLASYEARWFSPGAVFLGTAQIDAHGEAVVHCGDPNAPRWLLDWTGALLRLLARDHAADTPWPRRLTRWRKAPA